MRITAMKKSIIDRIFPRPSAPILPQHEQSEPFIRSALTSSRSPQAIHINEDGPNIPRLVTQRSPKTQSSESSLSPQLKDRSLRSTPLSASVLHHEDPFLPIERASKALEASIQLLLDAQSRALGERTNGADQDDVTTTGSLTPTQSATIQRSSSGLRTIPIRQPVRKPITLRGARKGLSRKMCEFAELREQELQILESQSQSRTHALSCVEDLESRREACSAEIDVIRQADTNATVTNLRSEAQSVKCEIEELEHRLLELRVRHRHILDQADQLESTLESEISSFKGTIAMIDKETKEFLRRPPVSHALAGGSSDGQPGMYELKPERRTLVMAREQWSSEKNVLTNRIHEVEDEVYALYEGERVWAEAVQRITAFEQELRQHTTDLASRPGNDPQSSMNTILDKLEDVIQGLESDLATAENKSWSLLICAIGPELEAFHQAQDLLKQTQQTAVRDSSKDVSGQGYNYSQYINHSNPTGTISSPAGGTGSNQSLKDTLHEFSSHSSNVADGVRHNSNRYESEDDEPPADFLLSR